jgi:septal ring factor EnvC (AmiA/AmiB activator)
MNQQQIEAAIARLKKERNGPHTMIEDLSFHLHAIDKEIAELERQRKSAPRRK